MRLSHGLRLGAAPRLAFVGAGGKTAALFLLARELLETSRQHSPARTVFLSATTHLATEQLAWADRHIVTEKPIDLESVQVAPPPGAVLFTGPPAQSERTAGVSESLLERLHAIAETHKIPLLIEADGSRQRPLKAPAAHEPVVPAWADCVLVVAGLSGLGRPFVAEWVHRPERFAELSGLVPGEPISVAALARVLLHPLGGLKGIPPGARRIALLNQADTPTHQGQALRLARELLPTYHAVLAAALAPLENPAPSWPSPGGLDGPVFAVHEPVAGIILAAGASSRLGQAKQLLPWRDQPLVRHVARLALDAGLSPLVVVTGFADSQVRTALDDLPIEVVYNPYWKDGQSRSVQAGLGALPPETGAAVFLLADQPHIPAGLVRSLVECHATTLSPIVAPLIDGQRANPVLFDRQVFPDLMALRGDEGGRRLFSRQRVAWVPWHDSTLTLDVDTQEDYRRLLEM
ncbi:MAG: putative selenium-dependent hydroxylase accessory protein YqeC [Anaerolineales bacterium]|nr:putative selenium-dependent hydroxylase accessory protein YqeC [Anaerolineales bacterium]